jgi:tetratricopeptide (TPR) repeat protein
MLDARTIGWAFALLSIALVIAFVRGRNRKYREVAELRERVRESLVTEDIAGVIGACDDLVTRFGDTVDPEIRVELAKALALKGATLNVLGRHEEALHVVKEMRARFSRDTETGVREELASLPGLEASALQMLGRFEEALMVLDEVIATVGEVPNLVPALVGKSTSLAQLGRQEEAILICNQVIANWGGKAENWPVESPLDPTPSIIREGVAQATFLKGRALGELGRKGESFVAFQELNTIFGGANEPGIRDIVAKALVALREQEKPPVA